MKKENGKLEEQINKQTKKIVGLNPSISNVNSPQPTKRKIARMIFNKEEKLNSIYAV